MSLENSHGDIDKNQRNIDNLDKNKDKGDVFQQEKDYARSFLHNIDDFQERVRKLPKNSKVSANPHLEDINNFLKQNVLGSKNQKNFQQLSDTLNAKLNTFVKDYEKKEKVTEQKHTVRAGDNIGKIVTQYFHITINSDPYAYFAAVNALHDTRENAATKNPDLLSIDEIINIQKAKESMKKYTNEEDGGKIIEEYFDHEKGQDKRQKFRSFVNRKVEEYKKRRTSQVMTGYETQDEGSISRSVTIRSTEVTSPISKEKTTTISPPAASGETLNTPSSHDVQPKIEATPIIAAQTPSIINKLQEKNEEDLLPTEPISVSTESPSTDIAAYFRLGGDYKEMSTTLEKATGLSLDGMLTKYMNYIEQELSIPEDMVLFQKGKFQEKDSQEVQRDITLMIENIKNILAQRIQKIPQQIEEIKEQAHGKVNRFMLNENIVRNFDDIAKSLLSSAKLYISMHTKEYRKTLDENQASTNERSSFRSHIISRMLNIKEGLIKKDTTSWWQVWKNKDIQQITVKNGEIPSGLIGDNSLHHEKQKLYDRMLQDIPMSDDKNQTITGSIEDIKKVNFLNEADQKTESEAMMYFMGACVFQMIPFLGTAASIPVDIEDALTSHEATLANLHRLGLVPKEYQMEKTWVDNLFGVVGIVGSAVGLQGLVKSQKITKALSKIQGFTPESFSKILRTLGEKTGISSENIAKITTMIFGEKKYANQAERDSLTQQIAFQKAIDTEIQKLPKGRNSSQNNVPITIDGEQYTLQKGVNQKWFAIDGQGTSQEVWKRKSMKGKESALQRKKSNPETIRDIPQWQKTLDERLALMKNQIAESSKMIENTKNFSKEKIQKVSEWIEKTGGKINEFKEYVTNIKDAQLRDRYEKIMTSIEGKWREVKDGTQKRKSEKMKKKEKNKSKERSTDIDEEETNIIEQIKNLENEIQQLQERKNKIKTELTYIEDTYPDDFEDIRTELGNGKIKIKTTIKESASLAQEYKKLKTEYILIKNDMSKTSKKITHLISEKAKITARKQNILEQKRIESMSPTERMEYDIQTLRKQIEELSENKAGTPEMHRTRKQKLEEAKQQLIILENTQKKNKKFEEGHQQNIEKNGRVELGKYFEKLKADRSQPQITRDILKDPNKLFKPEAVIKIQGQSFYMGPVINDGSGRLKSIMFVEKNGAMLPRFLYKSKSDGGWRSCPYTESGHYSKGAGIHYTQETKPLEDIIRHLEAADSQPTVVFNDDSLVEAYFSYDKLSKQKTEELITYDSEIKKYDDIGFLESVQGDKDTFRNASRYAPGHIFTRRTSSEELRNLKYPKDFIPNFSDTPKKTYQYKHTLLSKQSSDNKVQNPITIEVYEGTLNNRDVDWAIAYDTEGRVWVESIRFSESKTNSYGVASEVIDSGIITNKPLEYTEQSFALNNSQMSRYDDDYNDITPMLENLKPIQEFRQAKKEKGELLHQNPFLSHLESQSA